MKITFVLPHAGLSGGVRVVAIYAELLQARGHEVTIISTRYRFPNRREWSIGMMRTAWRALRGVPEPSHLNGLTVNRRIISHDPPLRDADIPDADVVVATWWETAEWVAELSLAKGEKVYFIQHLETHASQPHDRVEATWRLPMRKIVVAQWLADVARERFDDPDAVLVPNAVDASQFFAEPRGKQMQPTVGVMYSTKHYKGCDICIEACAIARESIPELQLKAFGVEVVPVDPPLPTGALYVSQPEAAKIREIYAGCDAWLFGSRTEGFGLPLLEAMACRTPIIATPVGAAPELARAGGGMLVEPEDPRAMAQAIIQIHKMRDEEWRRLSNRAHAIAISYTWDDAMDRFESALGNRHLALGTRRKRPNAKCPVPNASIS